MVDIIIPILNEEDILTQESRYFKSLCRKANVIYVDGNSTDRSAEIARRYGTILNSAAGRAVQKNKGAQESESNILLFLHVDTCIAHQTLSDIDHALKEGAVGGCLTMRIQDKGFIFRFYEFAVNWRAKLFGVIDGDLGMFVRKDIFEQMGGFDQVHIMEDLVFGKRLRKFGSITVLKDPIFVSSRKWRERGFAKTFIEYTMAYIKLWTGQIKPSPSFQLLTDFTKWFKKT